MPDDVALKVTQLDLQHYPALNFLPEASPEPPENPQVGQLWRSSIFDTLSQYKADLQWHLIIGDADLQQALDDAGYATEAALAAAAATAHSEMVAVDHELVAHEQSTSAHGIPDTSLLVLSSELSVVAFDGQYTSLHGIPDDDIPDLTILFENKLV